MPSAHNSNQSEVLNHGLFFYSSGEEFIRYMEMELPTESEWPRTTFLFAVTEEKIEKLRTWADHKNIPAGNLQFINASEVARELNRGGRYCSEVFQEKIRSKVEHLTKLGGSLWVFGEIVDVLCEQGLSEVANQLESDWNALLERYPFYLLCGYKRENFSQVGLDLSFDRVCKGHNKHLSLHCGSIPAGKMGILKVEHDNFLLNNKQSSLAEQNALIEMGKIHQDFLHELKNILLISNINFSRIHQLEGTVPEADREKFQKALSGLAITQDRLNLIVKDASDFVKLHPGFWSRIPLGDLLQKVARSFHEALSEADIGLDISCEETWVNGSGFLLEQVLLKTLEFAKSSLRESRNSSRQARIFALLEKKNGFAEITIGDNGNGIKAEYLNHIFQPFYTSKMKIGSPGFGLSYCKKVVLAHSGDMHCESVEGKGTTFRILLPLLPG